jgi:hypothetical protein
MHLRDARLRRPRTARGGSCARCQIEAMPSGLARTIREALYGVLYGRDLEGGPRRLIRTDPEAGT